MISNENQLFIKGIKKLNKIPISKEKNKQNKLIKIEIEQQKKRKKWKKKKKKQKKKKKRKKKEILLQRNYLCQKAL